jgi:hypothetical protein
LVASTVLPGIEKAAATQMPMMQHAIIALRQGQDGIQLHNTSARVLPHSVERLKADASGTYDQQQLLGQASQLLPR